MNEWSLDTRVAGVTFEGRQEAVSRVESGDWLRAVAEPDNEYDPNAVGLWTTDTGKPLAQVGYVPRREAQHVALLLLDGQDVYGRVMAVTGGTEDAPTIGLRVRLVARDRKDGAV